MTHTAGTATTAPTRSWSPVDGDNNSDEKEKSFMKKRLYCMLFIAFRKRVQGVQGYPKK
jgi:hypothetical protein